MSYYCDFAVTNAQTKTQHPQRLDGLSPMSHSKKRKLSGLSGLELQMAYNALCRLKSSFVLVDEESESEAVPNEPAPEGFEEQVDTMLSMMGSKLHGPQV